MDGMSTTKIGKKLTEYIGVIEHVRERKKQLGDEEKAAFAEAKAEGFDAATMRTILKLRAMDREKRTKAQELLDVYLVALGMADERPLFESIGMMGIDIAARESVIAALGQIVPATGDIIVRMPGGAPVKLWRNESGAVEVADVVSEAEAEGLRKARKKDGLDTYDRDDDEDRTYASPRGARAGSKSLAERIADRAEETSKARAEKAAKLAAGPVGTEPALA
jgi:uncharacterized protein (UPF0335 family)